MNDIFRQIVLAGGAEDLGAGDLVAAVALRRRAGAHQTEIGAALRLGEIHSTGPLAGHELWQIEVFLLSRTVYRNRGGGARGKRRIHAERHLGGGEKLADRLVDGDR